ncbi:efflux RND transporter periplasmic adaptor subunit [bacterium]|nr:efflux RND transporter periplasmic adaptor subunit [bacterium]
MQPGNSLVNRAVRLIGYGFVIAMGFWVYQERVAIVGFLRPPAEQEAKGKPVARLLEGAGASFLLLPETVESVGVDWQQVRKVERPIQVSLSGKLFLDPNRLVNVHARFAGEVVRLGVREIADGEDDRRLRFGDRVTKGQLLAVLWSKEVGDEKSDLVDAISRLRLDERTLAKLREIEPSGAVTERSVREAQRNFEADLVDSTRAERTLRSWRFSEEEIAVIRAEAERLHANPETKNPGVERNWAEVNIVSPIDGIIIEHNSPVGDVVDAGDVLFKVADLRRVGIVANLYEDDLPLLLQIPVDKRVMAVRLANDPTGTETRVPIERIGDVVDPNQHTVAVQGWIDNSAGTLRSGQFVTATIDSAPPTGLVVVPSASVIDQGMTGIIFVSPQNGSPEFTRRIVAVVRRSFGEVWIRSEPDAAEIKAGAQPLHENEWVVSAGALTLDGTLQNLQANASVDPHSSEGVAK